MFLIRKILKSVFLKAKNIFSVVFCKIKYLVDRVLFLNGKGRFSVITKSKYFVFFLFFGISVGGIVFGFQAGFIKNGSAIIKQYAEKSLTFDNKNQLELLTDASSVVADNFDNSNNDKNIYNISSSSDVALNNESNDKNSFLKSIENQNVASQPNNVASQSNLENTTTDSFNNEIVSGKENSVKNSNESAILPITTKVSNSETIFSKSVSPKRCEFGASNKDKPLTVVLNEIAWMGSPSSTSNAQIISGGQNDEWIELKNTTAKNISMSNWQIIDTAKNINIYFSEDDKIDSNSFYLLKRAKSNSSSTILIDKIYSGSLLNSGDRIGIFDENCLLIDEIDASSGWPYGDNVSKKTLERDLDNVGWHTSEKEGGTPRTINSEGDKNLSTSLNNSTSNVPSINKYLASVSIMGDGASKIINDSSSIDCGNGENKCSVYLNEKDILKLKAIPGPDAFFVGWSGACAGSSYDCSVPINGFVSISGVFRNKNSIVENNLTTEIPDVSITSTSTSVVNFVNEDVSLVASSSQSSTIELQNIINASGTDIASTNANSDNSSTNNNKNSPNHLMIFSVQIGGSSSSNDYVKIYNPLSSDIQIGGFKLRKKSKTGTDYSIKEFPSQSLIKANGFFVWANSDSDFASSINADVSSGVELSANNSIALFDKDGLIVDALAWGNGTNQYIEGSAFAQNPENSQTLERISKDGLILDTDNNSTNFAIL